MPPPLRKSDVFRSEIVTIPELLSDGYGLDSIYLSTIATTISVTQVVAIMLPMDDVSLIYSNDYQIESGDIITIIGTLPSGIADGNYTVNQVLTDNTFSVNEVIANSTDGYVYLKYPAGANLVGLNPTGMIDVTGNTVQQAIQNLDTNKLNVTEHETLKQLIHFLDNGPGDGFAVNTYREILPAANPFPTSVIWYTDSTKSKKIIEKLYTLTGAFPTSITWNMYAADGMTVTESLTDNIQYSGPFELYRTRTINL